MKPEDFKQLSINAWERYKDKTVPEQKTIKNMFLLGYQAAILEHSKEISDLRHYRDTSMGLFCTDRPDLVVDEKNVLFELK